MKRDLKSLSPRILIAPDKFKGSMTAYEISSILKSEIEKVIPAANVSCSPLADGGDGSIEILAKYVKLEKKLVESVDPLGRLLQTVYYKSATTAYIELASSSGLVLLKEDERNPLNTSTHGTGLEIKDALENGIDHIVLFLGGSATHDGGIGIAAALGYSFLDCDGKELPPIGASLGLIRTMKSSPNMITLKSMTLCCDVNNPPTGINGAASVYAKQKGASVEQMKLLDEGLGNLCNQIYLFNRNEVINLIGAGAAGGVPVCLVGLFGASIISGVDYIIKKVNLEAEIANSDFIISGEGSLDAQSLNGKVVSGVAQLCKDYNKPLFLTVGKNELGQTELNSLDVERVYEIINYAKDINDAIQNGSYYLRKIGQQIAVRIRDTSMKVNS
ncbi:MAG: glycerate kinase [Saprospiraceae bacterium]|jgi:glycerate kinase